MKPWARRFYSSGAWKKCREAYKAMVHYQCELCHGPGHIVHHKVTLTPDNISDPDVSLNFRNLRLVCRSCHGFEHGNAATVRGVRFDEFGNLVAASPPPLADR